jgi:uncharacterized membrane protein
MSATRATTPVPPHVTRAVDSVALLHTRAMSDVGRHQRLIEGLTRQVGRPRSLYGIAAAIAAWIALNAGLAISGRPPLDPPPFPALQCGVSIAALLIGTMVLTSQNRQMRHTEQRAQIDLEVNLQAEAKVTKLIQLVEELRRDMPSVPNRIDPVVEEMKEAADPHRVLSALEKRLEKEDEG